jgi:hypothetical protein
LKTTRIGTACFKKVLKLNFLFHFLMIAGYARACDDDAIALCTISWNDDANSSHDANAWTTYGGNSTADTNARPVGCRGQRQQRIFQN